MPSRSWNTSTCPSVAGPAPMPITGTSIVGISSSVTALGIASNTIAKQPRLLQRERLGGDPRGGLRGAALGLPAAERRGSSAA